MDRRSSRLLRFLEGDAISPLEMLVGAEQYGIEIVANAFRWAGIVLGAAAIAFTAGSDQVRNTGGLVASLAVGGLLALGIRVVGRAGDRLFFSLLAIGAGGMSAVIVWTAGPSLFIAVCAYPAYAAAVFLFFNRRIATVATTAMIVGYALVVSLADGYPRPFINVFFLTATSVATAATIGRLVSQVEVLSRRERSLHAEVLMARQQLETRVHEQGDEIVRLGRLRRFLSPQVAESILSSDDEAVLETHRRQIAVVFVDLRGFTAFSAVAEPEDVMEVLGEYYGAIGAIVDRLEATVGGFAGDGVMAYFNDPLPCDDPADRALEFASSLRDPMRALGAKWKRRGFSLGFGVGISYGYATLGTIGFESRSDYTPIGSVVNLAARLSDEATDGEALLDGRALEALSHRIVAEPIELTLKGFNDPVRAHRVVL